MIDVKKVARWAAPVMVSIAAFAFLLSRIDARAVVENLTVRSALIGIPALLGYGAVSLGLEARCLVRVMGSTGSPLEFWTAARIKAASYPLALVHAALGIGALTLLVSRRTGSRVGDSAGAVMLLTLFDVAVLLAMTSVGAALLSTKAPALQAGAIALSAAAIVGGFVLLRAPFTLGPLDHFRTLSIFQSARSAPTRLLAELAGLRFLFVSSFVLVVNAALLAFEVDVPIGDLIVNVAVIALVAALPIAVAGLGTGQIAFVAVFRHWAPPETLLACSLALSLGLIVMRAGLGLLFAHEYAREAMTAAREAEA